MRGADYKYGNLGENVPQQLSLQDARHDAGSGASASP
jgi:hypothetical protein